MMKRKRNLMTAMLRMLRRLGMVCKKKQDPIKRIRISKTLNPDGTVIEHDRITEQPLYIGSTFETELHIWKEIHKDTFSKKKSRKNK
jgi:hypothetical protein